MNGCNCPCCQKFGPIPPQLIVHDNFKIDYETLRNSLGTIKKLEPPSELVSLQKENEAFKKERDKLKKALEFYAQHTVPDLESEFAKSAANWGEMVCTWEPLLDRGKIAREVLKELGE